jgi:O-succinylhomoserine sulfhydrylase
MSNPTLELVDIKSVSAIAHAVGALVVVDNVFATPIFSKAVEQGADVIVYSTTKHIDGQGRALGGVVCSTTDFIRKVLEPYMKHTGGSISPFTAWLMLNGMVTLDLRCRAMADSALLVAKALEGDGRISRVIYPELPSHPQHELAMRQQSGLGGAVLSFQVKADQPEQGRARAFHVMNAMRTVSLCTNLGDVKTLVAHPASTSHGRLTEAQRQTAGIQQSLIRVAVGLEHLDDLKADFLRGFETLETLK